MKKVKGFVLPTLIAFSLLSYSPLLRAEAKGGGGQSTPGSGGQPEEPTQKPTLRYPGSNQGEWGNQHEPSGDDNTPPPQKFSPSNGPRGIFADPVGDLNKVTPLLPLLPTTLPGMGGTPYTTLPGMGGMGGRPYTVLPDLHQVFRHYTAMQPLTWVDGALIVTTGVVLTALLASKPDQGAKVAGSLLTAGYRGLAFAGPDEVPTGMPQRLSCYPEAQGKNLPAFFQDLQATCETTEGAIKVYEQAFKDIYTNERQALLPASDAVLRLYYAHHFLEERWAQLANSSTFDADEENVFNFLDNLVNQRLPMKELKPLFPYSRAAYEKVLDLGAKICQATANR